MIDTDKYKGHNRGNWSWGNKGSTDNGDGTIMIRPFTQLESKSGVTLLAIHHGDANQSDLKLIKDAPLLLEEVKRLQYLQKYAPTFQVFAQNEEDMEEEYTQHGSLKECKEYIAALEDGWIGRIEVIEYYVPTDNPQVKALEEWRNEE